MALKDKTIENNPLKTRLLHQYNLGKCTTAGCDGQRARNTSKHHNSKQIPYLSNQISKVQPSEAPLICLHGLSSVCVRAYVWRAVTGLPTGWTSKLSYQALLKLDSSPPPCLRVLPPRPKLLPPFGLPMPPFAGRLVDGQESANQGRPGSPAFSSPGRLQEEDKGMSGWQTGKGHC